MNNKLKVALKGCFGLFMIIGGIIAFGYSVYCLYLANQLLNPTDRQTIILAAVIIIAATRRK